MTAQKIQASRTNPHRRSTDRQVTLKGGPFDGVTVGLGKGAGPLAVEGEGMPDGETAQYRPTRKKGVYKFDRVAAIAALIPRNR